MAKLHTSHTSAVAQARWLQQAEEGTLDIENDNDDDDDDDDDTFLTSADDGPPGKHFQQLHWTISLCLSYVMQICLYNCRLTLPSATALPFELNLMLCYAMLSLHLIAMLHPCTRACQQASQLVVMHFAVMFMVPMLVIDKFDHFCLALMISLCTTQTFDHE